MYADEGCTARPVTSPLCVRIVPLGMYSPDAASCAQAFTTYGALLILTYFLPIWFQAIRGTSAIGSGVDMIPYFVVNAFFSLLAGVFVSAVGYFAAPAIVGHERRS